MIENRSAEADIRRFLSVIPMMATGVIGTLLGVWLLPTIDDRVMSVLLGLFMLLYIVWYFLNPERKIADRTAQRLAAPAGFGAGCWWAPPESRHRWLQRFRSLRLARPGFVFAVSVPFFFLRLMQIVSLAALGGYDQERVTAGIFACIPVVVVVADRDAYRQATLRTGLSVCRARSTRPRGGSALVVRTWVSGRPIYFEPAGPVDERTTSVGASRIGSYRASTVRPPADSRSSRSRPAAAPISS